jgi:hypothetical protein
MPPAKRDDCTMLIINFISIAMAPARSLIGMNIPS